MAAIIEQILANWEIKLNTILKANGFTEDVKSVQRFHMDGNDFSVVPLIILQFQEEELLQRSNTSVQEKAMLAIAPYIRHTKEDDARSSDTILSIWTAAIYQVIMADVLVGGLAQGVQRMRVYNDEIEDPIRHLARVSEYQVIYSHAPGFVTE